MDELATLNIEDRDGASIVHLAGEIDISNADSIMERIVEELSSSRRDVIDLSAVTYLDSTGVRMLVTLAARANARDSTLHVVVPDDAAIRRILMLVDLSRFATLHEAVADALA